MSFRDELIGLTQQDDEIYKEVMLDIEKDIDSRVNGVINSLCEDLKKCAMSKKTQDNCFVALYENFFDVYFRTERAKLCESVVKKLGNAFFLEKRKLTYAYNFKKARLFGGYRNKSIKITEDVPDLTLSVPSKMFISKLFDKLPEIDSACIFEVSLLIKSEVKCYFHYDDGTYSFQKNRSVDIKVPIQKSVEKITFEEMFKCLVEQQDFLSIKSISDIYVKSLYFDVKVKIPA